MKGEMQTSAQGDSNGTPRPQAGHGMIRKLRSYRFALSLPCIVFILEFQTSLESHTFCFKSLIPDSCSVLSGTHQWYLCLSLSLFCIRLDFFPPLAGSRRVQGDLNGTPGPLEGHGKRRPSMQTSNDYDRSLVKPGPGRPPGELLNRLERRSIRRRPAPGSRIEPRPVSATALPLKGHCRGSTASAVLTAHR